MSHFVPGRGWEPDPRGVDRNDPKAVADYERRYKEFYDKPIRDEGPRKPEKEVVTRPTRDLNTPKEPKYGRWQDAELPVWSGGSRDFDERSGTYRPGHRDDDYKFTQTDKGRNRERQRPEPKRNWWQEPRRDYRPEKTSKEKRMELLTGGTGTGGSSYSDRQSLLTGRGLSSNEDRQAMLTGRSDPPKEEWKSQYGGRREYDPQDRKFNRQFNTEPTANRDVRSWFDKSPTKKTGFYDTYSGDMGPFAAAGPIMGAIDRGRPVDTGRKYYSNQDLKNMREDPVSDVELERRKMFNEPLQQEKYDDSSVRERLRALEGRPQTGGWQEDRIKALENRPQSTGGNWDEARIKALESRSPIVNQPTVDLSGVEGRLSQLEGKGSDWQEDRIRAIEGRKPQDLSGIQGRLSELESKGPSWQEDRIKQLEGGRSESKSARNLLDQRIASLENYYKNDPPPEDSVGNRYEDKLANLNKMWEQQGSTWDEVKDTVRSPGSSDDRKWSSWGSGTWASSLPNPYVKQVRDLKKEYNKPQHTAIIKGKEYKAYGPRSAERLRDLDKWNIHEDEYLGTGTWKDQYGDDVEGWGKGDKDRYFASQSGLDRDSEEYKKRFKSRWVSEADEQGNWGSGKDYAYYN